MMRLHKFMADAGVASRRACEEMIRQGRVTVNGEMATIGLQVDELKDEVRVDGKRISLSEKKVVIMLNKPRGVVSTCSDPEGRRTTAEFFSDLPYRVYNVGRLDLDSEGLLLFTNDGDFANKMTHPSFEIPKTYRALAEGNVTTAEIALLEKGVMLSDGITAPARVFGVTTVNEGRNTSLYITIHEGRNRQVRRMLEAVGHRTLRLRRVAIGDLMLRGLRAGEWRYLTDSEITDLLKLIGK